MNVNVDRGGLANLVNAALPADKRNRNVAIVSDNWTGPNYRDQGFLSREFPRSRPKLYVTGETDEFDVGTLSQWRDEGFDVEYLPMEDGGEEYRRKIRELSTSKELAPCKTFGIVAFGDAASVCLEHYHVMDNNPDFKLGLLIAYYPTRIPDPAARFPSSVQVLVHLVGDHVRVVKQSQMVGIQGKRRVVKRALDPGVGIGRSMKMAYPCYRYDAASGFAEQDLDEYDRLDADLAWTRSLTVARRAFSMHVNVEGAVEQNTQDKYLGGEAEKIVGNFLPNAPHAHVTHVPTLTGGVGPSDLVDFYRDYFIQGSPPSLDVTLLSRTVGVDRVVDEMHVTFKHTQMMPWILPGVPATHKRVQVAMVSIVTLRGNRLHHEHVYWDQASVLVQVGLLGPNVLPGTTQATGVLRLPVIGKAQGRRMLHGMGDGNPGEADNGLIYEWENAHGGQDEEETEDGEEEDEVDDENDDDDGDDDDEDEDGEEEEEEDEDEDDGEDEEEGEDGQDNGHGSDHEDGEVSEDAKINAVGGDGADGADGEAQAPGHAGETELAGDEQADSSTGKSNTNPEQPAEQPDHEPEQDEGPKKAAVEDA